jgi:hypothetical protein
MVAFAGLFAGLAASTPLLNGQYLLLRREVYEATGGFASVKGEMLEDLAYAQVLLDHGRLVPMMRGEELAEVHMYHSVKGMWRGISRIGSGSLQHAGPTGLLPALLITGVMMPLWALFFGRDDARDNPRLWALWGAALLGYLPWGRRFGSAGLALLAPFAAIFIQASSFYGLVSRLLGRGLSWKGRRV